jgi:hypothetical protein
MKIILAGGKGLIGRELAAAFAQRGDDVIILTRRESGPPTSERIRYETWDGKTSGAWSRYFSGDYAVINLAGESLGDGRWTSARKGRIVASRVDSTGALLSSMREAREKPSIFVNMSAVGYYGPRWDDEPMTEESPAGSDFLAEVCARWENAAAPAAGIGIRTVFMRAGVALDARGGALPRMLAPFRLFAGAVTGSGKQWFPWIHLRDLVSAILHVVDNRSLSGPVNGVAPGIVRMEEFCRQLGKVLHRPVWMRVPAPAMRLLLGEMSEMVTTGQRVVPGALERSGFSFSFPDCASALRALLDAK